MRFETEGTYQGIPLTGWSLSRKPGMSSDNGWVEMGRPDLKAISLKQQFRPWVTLKNGKSQTQEPPGPMHLGAALKILAQDQTVAEDEGDDEKGKELNRGGRIRLTSTALGGGGSTVILDPMFLAPSGIREIEEDLASAVLHDESPVRIGVVDIRYWWDKYGTPVWGNYNITNEYGFFDESYLINKKPSSLGDVLKYLFLCLPGSPRIVAKSACFDATVVPPQNLKMRFELPSIWIDRLLSVYGFEVHLVPGGHGHANVYISEKGGDHDPQFFRSTPGGSAGQLGTSPESEKKTIYAVDLPECAFVSGGQRERRINVACSPCFTDEDGQVRLLEDLPKLWGGYTVEKAMAQMTQPHEKAGSDIPFSDGRQWHLRKEIMHRDFFRMYAPEWLFQNAISGGDIDHRGAKVFWDHKRQKHPFMPMRKIVFAQNEVSKIVGLKVAAGSDIPNEDGLIEFHPIVRASIIRKDYSADLTAYQKTADAAIRSLEEKRDAITAELDFLGNELAELKEGRPLLDVFDNSGSENKLSGRITKALYRYGLINVDTVKSVKQFLDALTFQSISKISKQLQDDADWNAAVQVGTQRLEALQERYKKELKEYAHKLLSLKEKFTEAFQSVQKTGVARMWVNAPYGLVDDVRVDKETGVVRFTDIAGVMTDVAVRDLENTQLLGAGGVELEYMYRTDRNRPSDYSYWFFMAPESGGQISLVTMNLPEGLKGIPIRDESLIVYEREDGTPLNIGAVTEKAFRIAGNILTGNRQESGFEYKYLGVWKVCTDEAQNEVQWTFDGDKAHTTIFVNHPDGSANGWLSLSQKRAKEKLMYPFRTDIYDNK